MKHQHVALLQTKNRAKLQLTHINISQISASSEHSFDQWEAVQTRTNFLMFSSAVLIILRPNYSPHHFLLLFSHNSKRLSLEISTDFCSKTYFYTVQAYLWVRQIRSFWHLSIDYHWHDKGWWDVVNTKEIYLHFTHIVSLNNNL